MLAIFIYFDRLRYSSSHNHGSVKNRALEDEFSLQTVHVPLNHDIQQLKYFEIENFYSTTFGHVVNVHLFSRVTTSTPENYHIPWKLMVGKRNFL